MGRPDTVAVGTWVWLASELMFFAALFAAFFMIRENTYALADAAGTTALWVSEKAHLAVTFAGANTLILVLSSVTCQFGVHAAEHGQVKRTGGALNLAKWGMREWYILTFVLGSVFVTGQVFEYATLIGEGFTPSSNVYWSLFFLATGFHALHVLGGLFAFLFTLGRTYMARTFTHEQTVTAMVVSYYWHFVDVVWIVLFSAIYILP
ncbi:cytochrome c oxidase subunit 3 [Propionibacteriaceae bacterium G1746]